MNNDIFKKFTESARRVLIAAQKIAQTQNSGIGSEHLLLALAITPGTLVYDLLKDHGLFFDQIRLVINFNQLRTTLPKGLSPELKKILELAAKKASDLGQTKIEVEYLLWAIVEQEENLAHQIILRAGAEPHLIKQDLEEFFGESLQPPSPFPTGLAGFPPEILPGLGPTFEPLATKTERRESTKSKTPFLDEFASDLTDRARKNQLDPVIGRRKEIERVIQILCRRTKNNPVLVGDPGVGKTAIAEGVAQKITLGDVPPQLKGKRLLMLDLAMLVAGTVYRGQFEERLKKIIKEILFATNIILFIDEIHTVVGTGSAEGSMDAANILKPQLAKGELRLIGATTADEYRKYIEKDAALERRLQKIEVLEPTIKETIEILEGIKSHYEKYHEVTITKEAVEAAVQLSKRYISDRFLPDKAIDLLDEAASATHISERVKNHELLAQKEQELVQVIGEKEQAIDSQDFEKASMARARELQLKEEIEKLEKQIKPKEKKMKTIGAEEIARVVSLWTGIPVTSLVQTEKKRLLSLEEVLKQRIIGQEEAIGAISQAIRRARAGIANPRRPIGAFIFLGPTGVGKTELARVLAETVFGSEENLIKIDMSEFTERHTISRLVGAPPGYVGYEEAGKLTETVRRRPYSVVLFDEIEKAHPEVFNILLQIMEDGYLTDAKGKRVNFRNTIIILTSNIGLKELTRQAAIGFQAESRDEKENAEKKYEQMKERVLDQLKETFRPEFLNRLDKIIVFRPLDKEAIRQIVDLQIKELIERLEQEKIYLEIDKKVGDFISQKGYDPNFGARPIRRTIADYIEDPLSDKLLAEELKKGDKIKVEMEKGKIVFRKR